MILKRELNPKNVPLTRQQEDNLDKLLYKLNEFRRRYGKPMICTSGVRSIDDHIRIYTQKGIPRGNIPMSSNHLKGLAADFYDPNGEIKAWINKNLDFCISLGLYFEHFDYTPGWVHIQVVAPKSGKRFFIP